MLYRDLDVRIVVSCSPHDTDARGMREVAEEMCRGMSLRCVFSVAKCIHSLVLHTACCCTTYVACSD